MNKIIFDNIEFKNFLSFGNTWQSIGIDKGLNLIQGYDIDTGKSNGSGKSSLLELIPFALFGQTIKEVKKEKIPNWTNNTKCEVKLYFHINDDNYYFYRSIKPNKFIVEINEEIVPQLSNIRDFQLKINEEIIGIDFLTFKNLVYFSPNNTISIVSSKKEQKRKFLESLFDLKEFSDMMSLCNPKIRNQQSKIDLLENDNKHIKSNIDAYNDDIDNSKSIDTNPLKRKLNLLQLKLDGLNEQNIEFVQDEYDKATKRIKDLQQDEITISTDIDKLDLILSMSKNIDIKSIIKKIDIINNKISEISDKISEIQIDSDLTTDKILVLSDKISDKIEEHEKEIKSFVKKKHKILFIIDSTEKDIKSLNDDILNDEIDCPLCKQKIDYSVIEDYNTKKEAELYSVIKDNKSKLVIIEDKISSYTTLIDEYEDKQKEYSKSIKKIETISILEDKIQDLQISKQDIGDIDDIKKEYLDNKKEYDENVKKKRDISFKLDLIQADISIANDAFNALEIKKDKVDKATKDKVEIKNEIDQLSVRIKDINKIAEYETKRLEDKKQKITEYNNKINKNKNKIQLSLTIIDHLQYIKLSLKDENIKQYTISSLLPFLNNQTNYYLSESGFPYSVSIDGWLDVEIKGFGVDNVSYSSLSGGERKSIDMSLQFACNDLSELQAKTTLNIRIYDEILDSSLDTQSLYPILNIMRTKQEKDKSSIYVITHRDDIKELQFDNYINIEKNKGFSVIKKD